MKYILYLLNLLASKMRYYKASQNFSGKTFFLKEITANFLSPSRAYPCTDQWKNIFWSHTTCMLAETHATQV